MANKMKQESEYETFDSHDGPTVKHPEDGAKMDGPSRPFTPHYGPREDLQGFGEKSGGKSGKKY